MKSRSSNSITSVRHSSRGTHDKYEDERDYNYGTSSSWRKHSQKDEKRRDIKTEARDEFPVAENKGIIS